MRALIAAGTGRYGDTWHPFVSTSTLLAGILSDSGFAVDLEQDVDRAMSALAGVDLLVVNAGDPWRDESPGLSPPAAAVDGFEKALQRGLGVLGLHASVASLRDYPSWAPAIGGMWLPGMSWHPPAGPTRIRIVPGIDILAGLADFEVADERYLRLQAIGRVMVVAEHTYEGRSHPTAWLRHYGRSRVAADLLGHDERSFESAGHRELVARLARWATGLS
jgi:type 1 glutamine amidotransferase